MSVGSGLSSQVGFAAESTYGTAATPTRFLPHSNKPFEIEPKQVTSDGITADQRYPSELQTVHTTRSGTGNPEYDLYTRGLGVPLKQALGSAAVATLIAGTSFYQQIHNDGELTGISGTWQDVIAERGGTKRAYTYVGCKVKSMEISCKKGELAKVKFELDIQDCRTDVALASPAYIVGYDIFHWAGVSIQMADTGTLSSGVFTPTSPQPVTGITGFTYKTENPFSAEDFYANNGALKSEPVENDHRSTTLSLEGDFTSESQFYTPWRANTTKAIVVTITGTQQVGGRAAKIQLSIPAGKLTKAGPEDNGKETATNKPVITAHKSVTATLPGTQIVYESLDTAL